MATVKVDKETYAELNRIAGQLRAARGRPVPIDEVIRSLLRKRGNGESAAGFIGSWKMGDEEEAEIFGGLRALWSEWKPKA